MGAHDLGVGARDLDAGVETSLVVGVHDVSANHAAGADTAVVGTLRSRVAVGGPAKRSVVNVEHGVLLLETEPGLLVGDLGHDLVALVTVVRLVRGAIVVVAFGKDNDVVTTTERVGVVSDGAEVDIRVAARGLVGGRTVKVPLLEVLKRLDGAIEGGGLAADFTCNVGRR